MSISILKPASPLLKVSNLKDLVVKLCSTESFTDKVLPPLQSPFPVKKEYPPEYFSALHHLVNAPGVYYPEGTPNHLGARIPLQHTELDLAKWREHLVGYSCPEICQYLEFGFPLGLQQQPPPVLESSCRNHGSMYQYFTWLD